MRSILASALLFLALGSAFAQASQRDLINKTVSNAERVSLAGNVAPAALTAKDLGPRSPAAPVSGILVLQRSPENEAAFDRYLADLSNPASPHYHQWLTLAQIGAMYGPSANDLAVVASWLTSQGFTAHPASPDGMTLWFGGTVKQAQAAFHVSIRNLIVHGEQHYANVAAPQIPAALSPVVAQIIAFNDLTPKRKRVRPQPEGVTPPADGGGEYLAPADLATIYNYKPLFSAGITGKGVTIALLEENDQDSLGDWQIFRKVFGLARAYPFGSITAINPQGAYACTDPGSNSGGGTEEAIDVDAATASAPNATLLSAACQGSNGIGGAILALANLLQLANPPAVTSLSFGGNEPDMATTGVNEFNNLIFKDAAAVHISVFASSGDEGAGAFRDAVTTYGLRVNGNASSPFVTAVGATDTGVVALHEDHSTYFSSTNQADFGSALSYIPEIPWNATCASSVRAALNGYPTTGPGSFCNTLPTSATFPLDATGGGPSGCATGRPSTAHVVSGICQGYAKPSWQSLVGVPADGVRDIPDVSIFGSNNVFGLAFRICDSVSKSCLGDPSTWNVGSGTSIAAPLWAGIQALVNQATGTAWGIANPQLYALARNAYGSAGNASCNASLGNGIGSSCVFQDVTLGDNTVPCTGSVDCYNSGGTYGVLSSSTTALQPAYPAGTGYDLATGIGTPNVTNLVHAWAAAFPSAPAASSAAPN